jgi:hemerythrin
MALIAWNDSLSVKVAEIDQQHRKLITMINELNDAMKIGKGKDALGKILDNLSNYTATHFGTEEKYFAKFGYPDTANHKREHALFVQKVSAFKDGLKSGKLTLSIEVINFLSDWLKTHIMGTDQKYSQFFNAKGLK